MTCSMSRKGNCWDNAPAESFFSSLKNEQVHGCRYRTREEARIDLSGYIEPFYNRKRWHSAPGYLSPAGFMARPGWKEPHDSFVLVGEKPRKSHFQRCPANWHELAQMFVPGRVPEITGPLLAVILGLVLYFLDLRGIRSRMPSGNSESNK